MQRCLQYSRCAGVALAPRTDHVFSEAASPTSFHELAPAAPCRKLFAAETQDKNWGGKTPRMCFRSSLVRKRRVPNRTTSVVNTVQTRYHIRTPRTPREDDIAWTAAKFSRAIQTKTTFFLFSEAGCRSIVSEGDPLPGKGFLSLLEPRG